MVNNLQVNKKIFSNEGKIDLNKILKLTEINSNTEKNAVSILNNQYILQESLDILNFENEIDWNYIHHVSSNTYQLYLHSLMPISFLANAFELTNNHTFLDKALEIVKEWSIFEKSDSSNKFIWYDHSTAYRTHNLIHLYLCLTMTNNTSSELTSLILNHGSFLYNGEYYRKNNHGVMMDRALIQLGVVFEHQESQNWINKGIFRLKDNFYNNYSSRGVHLENSPEYHHVVQKLFLSTEEFLNKYDLSLGEEVIDKFDSIEDYYCYIVKPDSYLPMIGDSSKKKIKNVNKKYTSIVDIDAGISILQSENPKNPKSSTWMSFVCGYSTLTHKHIDDLSITLFYNGNDIFVDSGKHSYGSSPARRYLRSAQAHNTIVINDKNYSHPTPKDAKDKISITDFVSNNIYDFVKGKNLSYDGVSIERSVLFLKPDVCILFDKVVSNKTQKSSQFFTLAPDASIIHADSNKTIIKTPNSKVTIEQLKKVDELIVHKGDKNKPYAVISEKFSQLTETNQLEYVSKGESLYFLTMIKMGEENTRVSNIMFNSSKSILQLTVDDTFLSIVL